jgi:cytochrome c oxidase assembly protein subunit 15
VSDTVVTRGHCVLLAIASATTYLLIVMGGVVCVTGSGLGCPDWPTCYGRLLPPLNIGAIIETTHRFLAAVTSPLIVAAAVVGWRRYRSTWWLSRPPMAAVVLVLAVVVFGAFAVLTGLPPAVAAVDVGSALMVLALVLTTWTVARAQRGHPAILDRLAFHGSFARLTLAASTAVFLVLASGPLAADVGSVARCVGWPLYGVVAGAAEVGSALPTVRRALGAVAAVLIALVAIQAWRVYRGIAATLAIAFAVEAAVGALMLAHGFTMVYGVLYVAAGVGVWAMLVVLSVLAAGAPDRPPA